MHDDPQTIFFRFYLLVTEYFYYSNFEMMHVIGTTVRIVYKLLHRYTDCQRLL